MAASALLLLGVFAAAAGNPQEQVAPYQVGGRVFDQVTRQPVKAEVRISLGAGDALTLKTLEADELGSFLVREATYGPVWLVARAPGYGRAFAYLFADSRYVQEVEMLLPRGASVYGTILDSAGRPVSHASIKLRYKDSLLSRLMQSPARSAIERATREGFEVTVNEGDWHRGCLYTSCLSMGMAEGEFSVLDVDPNRPFQLVARHDTLGEIESAIFELTPGQKLEDVVLAYQ
jgi:hypothetical protein